MTATLESEEPVVGVQPVARDAGRRRFTIAVAIGGVVVAVPYLWILTDLWNRSPSLLRTVLANHSLSDFYDLQARAMFHGHLYVTNGSFGQETFIHDGRHYTYFGLFPSLLRMPILLFTQSLDGRLTALSMLLSWVVTGVFSALMLWRVRLLVRGPVTLGRAEAATYGVLIATILGGSVLVYLAASPWVYSEDIAWSVALTVGSLFALLGILEAPSWKRVTLAGVLILAASLTRGSSGYGCIIGAILAAAWFGFGRGENENRRWWWPVLLAGIIPLVLASAVSWAKFGIPYGYPLHDQVYFNRFLKNIKGSYFSTRYLPTTIATYLGLHGLNISPVFPFVTLPLHPARAVGNVPLFGTQEVTSVPESMPLLFLLSIGGAIAALRRRPALRARITVIPLIAAAAPCGAILIFGFLDNRFLGDFLPFLVLGSAVGAVDLWRRLDRRRGRTRGIVVGIVAVLGLFGIVANVGIASIPTGWWSSKQALGFVEFQKSVGDLTGHPLAGYVARGKKLPKSAPYGHLFIVGNCAGLYIYAPNGIRGWLNLEKPTTPSRTLSVTIHGSTANIGQGRTLFKVGSRPASTVSIRSVSVDRVRFVLKTASSTTISSPVTMKPSRTYRVIVAKKSTPGSLSVSSRQETFVVGNPVLDKGPISPATRMSPSQSAPVSVRVVGTRPGNTSVCRSLIGKD